MKFIKLRSAIQILVVFIFCLVSYLVYIPTSQSVSADETRQKYEADIDRIRSQIESTHVLLDGVYAEQTTLEQTLNNLNSQTANLEQIVSRTQTEIQRLNTAMIESEADIENQTAILKRIIVLLYKKSDISTFELIIATDSFDDYFDEQEYLTRLKDGIIESVDKIKRLQVKLESQKQYQTDLLENQQSQQIVLASNRWQQQQLLNSTNNEEAQFQAQLRRLRAEQAQVESQLQAYLNDLSGTRPSLGKVKAGDIIGKNGNNGWSTGPHLHLAIYSASDTNIKYDPAVFMKNRNLTWPMGGRGGWVSQNYHSYHRALDIAAPEGTPIKAIADGTIVHRGCLFTKIVKYSTFGIIIDHGQYFSLYIHLQAPNNAKYSHCSINRRSQYGTPSIDYSTTE